MPLLHRLNLAQVSPQEISLRKPHRTKAFKIAERKAKLQQLLLPEPQYDDSCDCETCTQLFTYKTKITDKYWCFTLKQWMDFVSLQSGVCGKYIKIR